MKRIIGGFLYGLIFGFGSPVPGVSAGTVAILLGVYDKFFSSINMAAARKNFFAIISFLAGWGVGLFGVSRIIVFLFDYHGTATSFLFIGLILGCVPMIWKKANEASVHAGSVVVSMMAFGFMVFVAFFADDMAAGYEIQHLGVVFVASFASSMAMLIPGVGGSLMMIVFGIYDVYIEAVASLDLLLLAVFGVSMVFGVAAGMLITKWLLLRFAQGLYFAILGFVLGSLFLIFPGFSVDFTGLVSVLLGGVGFVFAYWLSRKG